MLRNYFQFEAKEIPDICQTKPDMQDRRNPLIIGNSPDHSNEKIKITPHRDKYEGEKDISDPRVLK